ncbi:MAG TPA: PH domain-containing protein [Steroidobacteraceae bacterium]|nr:PH domain-containing protein [Steroidobacteraceae bacterium]
MTTIQFRAPWSRTVRSTTVLSLVILALPVLVAIFAPMQPPLLAVILLLALPPLLVATAFCARVRGYTLTEQEIIVHRGLWDTRLALAGLRSVSGDADAMRGSARVFGNGGLFSITGRYWNRKLGWYRAYVTDQSRAVVLRYADRTIVISPHDPQQFIMRAGTFIRIAGFPK